DVGPPMRQDWIPSKDVADNDDRMLNGPKPTPTDALALEYQRDYGTARGNIDVHDLMNDPGANGVCRVFGLSLSNEWLDAFRVESKRCTSAAPSWAQFAIVAIRDSVVLALISAEKQT